MLDIVACVVFWTVGGALLLLQIAYAVKQIADHIEEKRLEEQNKKLQK